MQGKSQEHNNKLTERYKMNKIYGQKDIQTPLKKIGWVINGFWW